MELVAAVVVPGDPVVVDYFGGSVPGRVKLGGIFSRISRVSGKRPSAFLEKISLPSRVTSNWPPEPLRSVASRPVDFLTSAARPAARGR